jgi:hypothetical protein
MIRSFRDRETKTVFEGTRGSRKDAKREIVDYH